MARSSARLQQQPAHDDNYNRDLLSLACELAINGGTEQFRLCPERGEPFCAVNPRGKLIPCAVTILSWGILRMAKHLNQVSRPMQPVLTIVPDCLCTSTPAHPRRQDCGPLLLLACSCGVSGSESALSIKPINSILISSRQACLLCRDYSRAMSIIDEAPLEVRSVRFLFTLYSGNI
jgi:hypothetical protein